MPSANEIMTYLWYGYRPDLGGELPFDEAGLDPDPRARDGTFASLVEGGIKIFERVVDDCLDGVRGRRPHVVPISGGFDSRPILAALARRVPRDDLLAVTFGTPRTLDFELGRQVAEALGVEHLAIDLPRVTLTLEHVVDVLRAGCTWTYTLDAAYHRLIGAQLPPSAVVWSGFFGDAIACRSVKEAYSRSWDEARRHFVRNEKHLAVPDRWLDGYDPWQALPSSPPFGDALPYYHQLEYACRQVACTRKVVVAPHRHAVTPYTSTGWVRFMAHVPQRYRENTRLWQAISTRLAGAASRVGMTAHNGRRHYRSAGKRWLVKQVDRVGRRLLPWAVNRWTLNRDKRVYYVDWPAMVRERPEFRELLLSMYTMNDAAAAHPWLDFHGAMEDHLAGRIDANRGLMLAASVPAIVAVESERAGNRAADPADGTGRRTEGRAGARLRRPEIARAGEPRTDLKRTAAS